MLNQKGFSALILLFVGLSILGIVGGVYYFGIKSNPITKTSGSKTETTLPVANQPIPSPVFSTEDRTEDITIQDDLSFSVLVPKDYSLNKSSGDGLIEIVSRDKRNSVLFYKSTGGGERGTAVLYSIDNVPFEMEYSKTLQCPAHLSAPKTKFYEGAFTVSLYFAISLNCQNETQQDKAIFEKIIGSIKFSPHLRSVLMGEELSPILNDKGVSYGDIDKANEEYKGIISQGSLNKTWKMYTGPTDNQNGKFSVEFPSDWTINSVNRRRLYLPNLDKQKYYVLIGTASKLYSNGENGNNCETRIFPAGSFEYCSKTENNTQYIIATLPNKDFPYKGAAYYAFLISYPVETSSQLKNTFDEMLKTVKRIE